MEVWRLFTKEDKKRQGPAVYLSLQGDAREAVRGIVSKDLASDTGYEIVIEERGSKPFAQAFQSA